MAVGKEGQGVSKIKSEHCDGNKLRTNHKLQTANPSPNCNNAAARPLDISHNASTSTHISLAQVKVRTVTAPLPYSPFSDRANWRGGAIA